MPPKPLAEKLARKKAERDKANMGYATPKNDDGGGWGWFGDLVANPLDTVKGLGQAAKQTFYDPVNRAQKAVNPFEDLTPMQRATGIAEGALVAADFLTPGVPEGAVARNLEREAMEKALDREVANYAASGRNAINHRTTLGIHGSPTEGLTKIMPNPKAIETARGKAPAWFWNPAGNEFDVARISDEAVRYSGPDGQVYFARFPKSESHYGWTVQTGGVNPPTAWYSEAPGDVVGSMEGFWSKARTQPGYGVFDHNNPGTFKDESYAHDFVAALERSMTPAERRAFREKQPNLANILAQRKARVNPAAVRGERFTEEELNALRLRPTLQQLQKPALRIELDEL